MTTRNIDRYFVPKTENHINIALQYLAEDYKAINLVLLDEQY